VHVDPPSFSGSGASEADPEAAEPAQIAITYGYSRDHRADLKQWMLAVVTTHDGDVPLFMRPLDGNSRDKASISAVVAQVIEQLGAHEPTGQEEPLVGFDSGGYSQANMKASNEAKIRWCSRVPETGAEAKVGLAEEPEQWQELSDQRGQYVRLQRSLPQAQERWLLIRTSENLEAARSRLQKKASQEQALWEKRLWHLSSQSFACQADAEVAWQKAIGKLPVWLRAQMVVAASPHYGKAGRPGAAAHGVRSTCKLVPTVQGDQQALQGAADQQARFLIASNELSADQLSDEELLAVYKGQGSVEGGFRFLKDPLFLASSVFVKKPSRLMALSCIMLLCLLIYRLAEQRLRHRLQQSQQTIPNQLNKPTDKPTMRWVFQCFEGIELLDIRVGSTFQTRILRLQSLHQRILPLLGPAYQQFYFSSS
jgi:transposase